MGEYFYTRLEAYGFWSADFKSDNRLQALIETIEDCFLKIINGYNVCHENKIMHDCLKATKRPINYSMEVLSCYINDEGIKKNLVELVRALKQVIMKLQNKEITIFLGSKPSTIFYGSNCVEKIDVQDGKYGILGVVIAELLVIQELFNKLGKTINERIASKKQVITPPSIDTSYESLLSYNLLKKRSEYGVLGSFASILDNKLDILSNSLEVNPLMGEVAEYMKKDLYASNLFNYGSGRFKPEVLKRRLCNTIADDVIHIVDGQALSDSTGYDYRGCFKYRDLSFGTIVFGHNGFCQLPSDSLRKQYLLALRKILKNDGRIILTTTDYEVLKQVNPEAARYVDTFIRKGEAYRYGFDSEVDVLVKLGGVMNYDSPTNYEVMFNECGLKVDQRIPLTDSTGVVAFDHLDVGRAYVLTKK